MKRIILLALALLLTSITPVQAIPVTFDFPHGGTVAILQAPACKWGWTFGAPHVAPPCLSPLFVEITLQAGDPTSLWGTLAYYPEGFRPGGAVGVSQDRRVTDGGFERFALPPGLVNGDYFYALSLSHIDYNASFVYSFTLEWPAGSPPPPGETPEPPLEATPEPATILLFGLSMAAAGIWRKRRRQCHQAAIQ